MSQKLQLSVEPTIKEVVLVNFTQQEGLGLGQAHLPLHNVRVGQTNLDGL